MRLEEIPPMALLWMALGVMPLAYLGLCVWMARSHVHWQSYAAQFLICGTIGGWCLTLALTGSPLGLMGMMFMLATSPACLVSSLLLHSMKRRNGFDTVAMIAGYGYTALLAAGVWLALGKGVASADMTGDFTAGAGAVSEAAPTTTTPPR